MGLLKAIAAKAFLAAEDRPLEKVPLPECYGKEACFYVRRMSGTERSEIEKRWYNKEVSTNPGGFRWDVLLRTIVDEGGNAIFTADMQAGVMGKNAGTLEMLFEKACELNGLRAKDVEELEKNSESGQSSGSSSDCAYPA
jgi:hypothetical protein